MYIYTLLLACSEPKETDTAPPVQEVVVYGTCSLETVSYDNNDHNAYSTGAHSVSLFLGYIDNEFGLQEEDHPFTEMEGTGAYDHWSLDLATVYEPEDVILGETTMSSIGGEKDKLFLGLNENGEVCDCWDTNSWEKVVKDCTDFGAP